MAVIIQGLIPEGYSPNSVVDFHVGQKQESRAVNYISTEIRPREYIPMHSKCLLQGIILIMDLSNHCIEKPNYPCSPYSIKAEKPDQIASIRLIIEKARVPEKHLHLVY